MGERASGAEDRDRSSRTEPIPSSSIFRRSPRDIRAGAEAAGRDFDAIDLQAGGAIIFSDDPERVAAEHARGIAFTLGAMGSAKSNFYNDAFCRQGYADEN